MALVVVLVFAVVVSASIAVLLGGLLLPREQVIERHTQLPASADAIWALLADPPGYPAWRRGVRAVDVLGTSPLRWREFGEEGGVAWQVQVREVPVLLRITATDEDLMRQPTRQFRLTAGDHGTQVSVRDTASLPNPVLRFVYRYLLRPEPALEALLADLRRAVN
jgi:uncharacterized membrane protein